MESGWLVNSNFSNSEGSLAAVSGRSNQISPIALPSWRALLQGRRSTTPQGFRRVCARACSIVITPTAYSTERTFFGRGAVIKFLDYHRDKEILTRTKCCAPQ